ncbi:hypothetical protein BAUCODRAFT_81223, partial [Baudoinia panamericana UAMH 10762]
MAQPSGYERFVALMGGQQNLPPKRAMAAPPKNNEEQAPPQASTRDPFETLPSLEEVIAQTKRNEEEDKAARAAREQASQASDQDYSQHQIPGAQASEMSSFPPSYAVNHSTAHMGTSAPRGITFTPFLAVTRYCYKFVSKEYMQPLATAFFDANKIYDRPWDFFYLWSAAYETSKPLTFVPTHQLQSLLDEINQAFPRAHVKITNELVDDGLVLCLDDFPDELRPRWLGQSMSKEQYEQLTASIPFPEQMQIPEHRTLEAYKDMVDRVTELNKNKSKAKRKGGQQAAIHRRQEVGKQVVRAQRLLGLRQKNEQDSLLGINSLSLSTLDPTEPVPYPFELDVIFIAVDAEAYELSPKVVTEVGVATLDTRDLQGQAPGRAGEEWHKHIRARHFRIVEHKKLVNSKFVQGSPDRFEFGKSEFVGKEVIASQLTACFHEPFSKSSQGEATDLPMKDGVEERRNIVLLGHGTGQDIAYLQSIGFSVLNRSNLLEAMDTAIMFRSYTGDNNPTSLGRVLYHFDLEGWSLHNAGNDAVYTLRAMLAICVKAAVETEKDVEVKHEEVKEKRREDALAAAVERVEDDHEGWGIGKDEDGG